MQRTLAVLSLAASLFPFVPFTHGAPAVEGAAHSAQRRAEHTASRTDGHAATWSVVSLAPAESLPTPRPVRTQIAIAPDGGVIVFAGIRAGRQSLFVRKIADASASAIPGTDGASAPFFSPDGRSVGFWSAGALRRVRLDGSAPVSICPFPAGPPLGASWGRNDRIVFSRGSRGLWAVTASGGTPQLLVSPDAKRGEYSYTNPFILADGDTVLFTVTTNFQPRWDESRIVAYSGRRRRQTVITTGGSNARFVAGHLVFARSGTLVAAPFDPKRLQLTGAPVEVESDVMHATYQAGETISGAAQYDVAETGTLVYARGGEPVDPANEVVLVDRTGRVDTLPIPPGFHFGPRLSPDAKHIAFYSLGRMQDLWLFDLHRRIATKVGTQGRHGQPIWTPQGDRLVYRWALFGPHNLFSRLPTQDGAPVRIGTSANTQMPVSFTPDGREVVFFETSGDPTEVGVDVFRQAMAGGPPQLIARVSGGPVLSPDGRWLAYHLTRSGRDEVFVQPYPGPGEARQISTAGGLGPIWSRDGAELFYWLPGAGDRTLMVARFDSGSGAIVDAPAPLLRGRFGVSSPGRSYDVFPDGQRFVLVRNNTPPLPPVTHVTVVHNWLAHVHKKFIATATLAGTSGAATSTKAVVVEGGTLIDGTGRAPLPNSVVVMEGGRITAVGPKGRVTHPRGARVIRLKGESVLPGLIDSHVHLRDWQVPMFLPYGVTTIADIHNDTAWSLAQRDALRSGRIKGPRLFVSGARITGPQGPAGADDSYVRTEAEARAYVRRLAAAGVDQIKVDLTITDEQLKAVIDEAAALGLPVLGHTRNIRRAVELGMKHMEHTDTMARALLDLAGAPQPPPPTRPETAVNPAVFPRLIELFVKEGVYVNPTLVLSWPGGTERWRDQAAVAAPLVTDPRLSFVPADIRPKWTTLPPFGRRVEGYGHVARFLKELSEAGGKLLVGTDAGCSNCDHMVPGLSLHYEMQMLVDLGVTPMRVIQAATLWNAEAIGRQKDLGSVEPGKLADVTIIKGNPLADIGTTRNIHMVIKDGVVVDTTYDPAWVNPIPKAQAPRPGQ